MSQAFTDWHRQMAASIAAAHPLVPSTPIRAGGNHLAAQNDERESGDFTEAELVQADLDYLNNRQQRDAERVRIAHQLDLDRMRREGAL